MRSSVTSVVSVEAARKAREWIRSKSITFCAVPARNSSLSSSSSPHQFYQEDCGVLHQLYGVHVHVHVRGGRARRGLRGSCLLSPPGNASTPPRTGPGSLNENELRHKYKKNTNTWIIAHAMSTRRVFMAL